MKAYCYSFEELGEGKFVLNMSEKRLESLWRWDYYRGYSFRGRNIYLHLDEINSAFYWNFVTLKKLTKREKKILLDAKVKRYKGIL